MNELHFYKNKQSAKRCSSKTKQTVLNKSNKPNLRKHILKTHSNSLGENSGQNHETKGDRVEIEANMSEVNGPLDVIEEEIIETDLTEPVENETNTKDNIAEIETFLDKKPYKCINVMHLLHI